MKNILKFGLIACLATAFVLAGCKKDDDDDNNGGSNNSVSILPKKVSKIVETFYEGHDGYPHAPDTYTFDSEGRLISREDDDDSNQFSYSDNAIVMTHKYDGKTSTYVLTVSNGRMVDLGDGEKITYSSDGYLSTIDWGDGETTKLTIKDSKLTEKEESGTDHGKTYTCKYKYTYDNNLNNLNVDLAYLIIGDGYLMPGYMGKRLKYMPISKTEVGGDNDVTKFTYIYDGDYLTKVIANDDDGDKTTYEIFY